MTTDRNTILALVTAIQEESYSGPLRGKKMATDWIMSRFDELMAAQPEAEPKAHSPGHKTIPLKVWVDVDEGIANLVEFLNTLPGIRTFASCQGSIGEGGPEPYKPQVMVGWTSNEAWPHVCEKCDVTLIGDHLAYVHPRPGVQYSGHPDELATLRTQLQEAEGALREYAEIRDGLESELTTLRAYKEAHGATADDRINRAEATEAEIARLTQEVINLTYSNEFHRKAMESWRGRAIAADELEKKFATIEAAKVGEPEVPSFDSNQPYTEAGLRNYVNDLLDFGQGRADTAAALKSALAESKADADGLAEALVDIRDDDLGSVGMRDIANAALAKHEARKKA